MITKKLLWPILAIMYQYLCLVWVVVTGVTFDLVTCAAVTCTAVTSASDCYSNKLTYHWMTHSHMTLQHIDTYATVCHISTLIHMQLSVTLAHVMYITKWHITLFNATIDWFSVWHLLCCSPRFICYWGRARGRKQTKRKDFQNILWAKRSCTRTWWKRAEHSNLQTLYHRCTFGKYHWYQQLVSL